MNSRRSFIKKSSLVTIGALNYNFTSILKNIKGVDISVITYSFSPGNEDMNVIIQNCIDSGSDNIELMGSHIERSIGMPRSNRFSAEWRENVSMKLFKEAKKLFNEYGEINIFAYKPNCIGKNNSDGEIEYAMKATKALGAEFLTNELMDEESIERVNFFSKKNNVKVAYHAHSNNLGSNVKATDSAWDYALNSSKNNYVNLDIGHYINVGGSNNKESLIEFIKRNNKRISSLHLKDRQAGKSGNIAATDNQIWGFGDTPIIEVLQLIRDNSYKFTSTIELEYRIPEGSNRVLEVKKCMEYCKKALS
ncbi:MAG: sugar phosphate isomerase/epimerase [Bacteroidota bacterium]